MFPSGNNNRTYWQELKPTKKGYQGHAGLRMLAVLMMVAPLIMW